MRVIHSLVVLAFLAGCSPPDRPPLAPDPIDDSQPVLLEDGRPDPIPRSIRRLLSEQRETMADIESLVPVIGDARGRARAAAIADLLAGELARVAARIEATNGESDRLDETFEDLRRLSQRISTFHESLRGADLRAGG
jgi:hypothetical protein